MNTIREIQKINDEELKLQIAGTPASWHSTYKNCAWIYVGNLIFDLTEGDVICILSQFGEIEDLHLVRDEKTGQSRGFAFAKYEDARSCILAVDNLSGSQILERSLRVDHVENYRLPKHVLSQKDHHDDDMSKQKDSIDPPFDISQPGSAYQGKELANKYSLSHGIDLFAKPQSSRTFENDGENGGDDGDLEERIDKKRQRERKEDLYCNRERKSSRKKRERVREHKEQRYARRCEKKKSRKDSSRNNALK